VKVPESWRHAPFGEYANPDDIFAFRWLAVGHPERGFVSTIAVIVSGVMVTNYLAKYRTRRLKGE
jgi:hypothetical protein